MKIYTNIVNKDNMRYTQKKVLKIISESLLNSFGPMGSNTIIFNNATKYTKDGHTILKNIRFLGCIEETVRKDIEEVTRHIVRKVGDGTTSAVLLSDIIFNELVKLEDKYTPYELMNKFNTTIKEIESRIKDRKKDFNSDIAYEITKISTNGNEEVSQNIKKIYDDLGNDVFISVSSSNDENSYLKIYDGMTLDSGYSDIAYINDKKRGTCTIHNPEIYYFEDPIDMSDYSSLLDAILKKNLYTSEEKKTITPTVILAPSISRDMSSYIANIVEVLLEYEKRGLQKPPILIITNYLQNGIADDICRMCGCKPIRKYIDNKAYQEDIKRGLAPTVSNIKEFAGTAKIVESDLAKTKFIRPAKMFDNDTTDEYSADFNSLLEYLESELKRAKTSKDDTTTIGRLKKRINSLKANMVEYFVGGVSISDRDSVKDLLEDAVLNCRSASINGYGYGANFEALKVIYEMSKENPDNEILSMLYNAYSILARTLYSTNTNIPESEYEKITEICLENDIPYNVKTLQFDENIVCSIDTDITILNGINKIITLMFTSNQFLLHDIGDNRYKNLDNTDN